MFTDTPCISILIGKVEDISGQLVSCDAGVARPPRGLVDAREELPGASALQAANISTS